MRTIVFALACFFTTTVAVPVSLDKNEEGVVASACKCTRRSKIANGGVLPACCGMDKNEEGVVASACKCGWRAKIANGGVLPACCGRTTSKFVLSPGKPRPHHCADPKHCNSEEAKEEAEDVKERNFGGALMTSGSYTQHAAGSGMGKEAEE